MVHYNYITKYPKQTKFCSARNWDLQELQEIILESGDLTKKKKGLLDKNVGENEVKEGRVKTTPG